MINPSQDVVLGLYYISREKINAVGEGSVFSDVSEVMLALDSKAVELQTKIQVRITEKLKNAQGEFETIVSRKQTTVGRAIIWGIAPDGMPYELVNVDMTKKNISRLINYSYRYLGIKETVILADKIMYLGFKYATRAGVSFGIEDMEIPLKKADIIRLRTPKLARSRTSTHPVWLPTANVTIKLSISGLAPTTKWRKS